jgi:GMP synthase PP-ATPase subunit
MVLKEQNYILLNEKEKEKFEIVQEQNKELRKEIRKMKVKNTIIQIFGGAVITTLTGVLIFK